MKRTSLRRMSAKRRAALATRVRVGVQIPATCELCGILWDVAAYEPDSLFSATLDPHHVFSRRLDHPCNVVTACRTCHNWVTDRDAISRLVGTWVLVAADRFDRQRVRDSWGRDPVAYIESHYGGGTYRSDPVLDAMATVLLGRF